MKTYKVITDLVVKEFPLRGWSHEYVYFDNPIYPIEDEGFIGPDPVFKHRYLPIHKFFHSYGRFKEEYKETLVAYTPEVEELLGIPINALAKQAEEERKRADVLQREACSIGGSYEALFKEVTNKDEAVKTASLWTRIKYVFGVPLY